MESNRILGIRANLWGTDSTYTSTIQTMLSPSELRMLEWLARTMPLEDGAGIVDAGAFLGGSTRALAAGLAANSYGGEKAGVIHAYDMFQAPRDEYVQQFYNVRRPVGASVLDIFQDNLREYQDLITVHAGDFSELPPPAAPIGLLFVDLAKSWELNEVVIREYMTRLAPGAIVVQQDHNDQSCPWVNITMEFFADNFEYLVDDGSSRVYVSTSPITPPAYRLRDIRAGEKIRLLDRSIERSKNPVSKYLAMTCKALVIFEEYGYEQAMAYLDSIEPLQPWESPTPYVDTVRAAITYLAQLGGHDVFIADYFKSTSPAGLG